MERPEGDLEPKFDQHGTADEKKTMDFCSFFECPEHGIQGILGLLLGSPLGLEEVLGASCAVLGASWTPGGRLGAVLGVSGSAWER